MTYINEYLNNEEWKVASNHSKEADRDAQYDRFIASGMDPETLRKSQIED